MYTNVTVQKHPIWRPQHAELLQAVAIRGGPDRTHTTNTVGIVRSVDINTTACYSLSAIEYSTGCSNKIISASLCISTASISAHLTDLLPSPSVGCVCVCQKVYCGKTAEWIRMPFGMVSGVSRLMGVLDGVVIVEVEGAFLRVNLRRPTVTNGDYAE